MSAEGARPVVVCGIVGARNAGKTTVAAALTRALQAEGVSVAYLKRTSHGFDVDQERKDTGRLTAAGATAVAAIGDGRSFLVEPAPDDPEPMLARLACYDVVLAEGWHEAPWPKVRVTQAGAEPRAAAPTILAEVTSHPGGVIEDDDLAAALDAIRALASRG